MANRVNSFLIVPSSLSDSLSGWVRKSHRLQPLLSLPAHLLSVCNSWYVRCESSPTGDCHAGSLHPTHRGSSRGSGDSPCPPRIHSCISEMYTVYSVPTYCIHSCLWASRVFLWGFPGLIGS